MTIEIKSFDDYLKYLKMSGANDEVISEQMPNIKKQFELYEEDETVAYYDTKTKLLSHKTLDI